MAEEKTVMDTCSTAFGRFRIKIDPSNLFVGGLRFCVSIAIQGNHATLSWLSTEEGGCELDGKVIRKESTIQMVDLAFSLLRIHFPQCKEVTLLDDSGISWMGQRGRKYKVNFLKGYVLFYQQTWYEQKFGATIVNDAEYERYRTLVSQNFTDPSKKPATFSFGTYENELMPLYREAATWKEFTDAILRLYGDEKYKMCYDWYRMALYHILDGVEINQYWKITLEKRPFYPCDQRGGKRDRRITQKKRTKRTKRYYPIGAFNYPERI